MAADFDETGEDHGAQVPVAPAARDVSADAHEGIQRLQFTCWVVCALAVVAGVCAYAGMPSAEKGDPLPQPVSSLMLVAPWLSFLAAALVLGLHSAIRRQGALELGLCWANQRLESKITELTWELAAARSRGVPPECGRTLNATLGSARSLPLVLDNGRPVHAVHRAASEIPSVESRCAASEL